MVNLPPSEGRRLRRLVPRSHHNWGLDLNNDERERARQEPRTLNDLEKLAQRAVANMSNHSQIPDFATVLSLLREQYNLTFKLLCSRCNGTHGYDELDAPER